MNTLKSVIFEGKPCPVIRCKVENRIDPPPPRQSDYPIPKPPAKIIAQGEPAGKLWFEKQLKPYEAARAKWEKDWAGKTRFFVVVEIEMLAQRWRGHFMGPQGGAKLSESDLIGASIRTDNDLIYANGKKGIHGRVEELTAAEIRDNRDILAAREGMAELKTRKPSPNPRGRKEKYKPEEDARILALFRGQPVRISIETFREENTAIKKAYTLPELRQLVDRAGKRERKAIAMKQKEGKLKKRQ